MEISSRFLTSTFTAWFGTADGRELCRQCHKLGIEKLVYADCDPSCDDRRLSRRSPFRWLAQLGTIAEISTRADDCKLCEFVRRKVLAYLDSEKREQNVGDHWQQQVVMFMDRAFSLYEEVGSSSDSTQRVKFVREVALALTSDPTNHAYDAPRLATLRPTKLDAIDAQTPSHEKLKAFGYDGFSCPELGHARLFSSTVNLHIVREWLDLCRDKHHKCNKPYDGVMDDISVVRDLRVVDVKRRCITVLEAGCPYVVLSYVWGDVTQPQLTKDTMERLSRDQGLNELNSLPSTIKDAMFLVERLGERYLWVDALCISQDDEDVKQTLMSQMHLIYLNALMTIVAAAGSDANAGLPGLRPNTRIVDQEILSLSDIAFITVPHDSYRSRVEASVWKGRGWTYQELLFSPRLLVFTEDLVLWHCNTSAWREDMFLEHHTPSASHVGSPEIIIRGAEHIPLLSSTLDGSYFETWRKLVSPYCIRQLKFPHDKMRAFLGIQNALTQATGIQLFWGHPEVVFTHSLAWSMRGARRNKSKLRQRGPKSTRIEVETSFPSWSWTGWSYANGYDRKTLRGLSIIHEPCAELVFYRQSIDGKLCKVVERQEIGFLPGHDTFWPVGEGPKQEDWHGSPREILGDVVVPAANDGDFVDAGLLQFFTRTAPLRVRRVLIEGLQETRYQLTLSIRGSAEVLSKHVNLECEECLEKDALDVQVVALGRIWSFDTVCLLTEVDPVTGINYRVGIAIVEEKHWTKIDTVWRRVTLG
jgi:hypothetical protein